VRNQVDPDSKARKIYQNAVTMSTISQSSGCTKRSLFFPIRLSFFLHVDCSLNFNSPSPEDGQVIRSHPRFDIFVKTK